MNTLAARRRHPMATVVLIALGLMLVGFLYTAATSATSAEASSAASTASTTDIDKGRQLFLEGCSSCHGLNAQGGIDANGNNAGPTLVGVGAAAVDFQVGTGRMPLAAPGAQAPGGKVTYTSEEIDAMSAYIASLGPGPSMPSEVDLDYTDANVAEGGNLFRGNCAQCHNFAGQGGALTQGKYAPSIRNVDADDIWAAMLTGPQSMPVFSDKTITPDQKRDIIKYIKTTEENPTPGGFAIGKVGPVSEGLVAWVIGLGLLSVVAVWIGARSS